MVNLGLLQMYFKIFSMSNFQMIYTDPSLLTFKLQKIFKCFTIYGHDGHCKVGLDQPVSPHSQCCIPCPKEMILKGFYLEWAWWPS